MARAQVGGKQKGPRDPTKEARIQAAIQDTLTGVHGSFRSAANAHNVPPQTSRQGHSIVPSRHTNGKKIWKHSLEHSDSREMEKLLILLHGSNLTWKILTLAQPLQIILDFRHYMIRNDALANLLPLPTQLRMKTQHLQQVLLSPRQPTMHSIHRSHHFFRRCKDLSPFLIQTTYIMLAPRLYSQQLLLSYLHHRSHWCLMVSLFITPATRNTYSTRLLHTIATVTLVLPP